MKIKISKKQWESIGKKYGWTKIAEMDDRTPCKCRECGKTSTIGECSKNGVWKGCPSCGSKNVEKNYKEKEASAKKTKKEAQNITNPPAAPSAQGQPNYGTYPQQQQQSMITQEQQAIIGLLAKEIQKGRDISEWKVDPYFGKQITPEMKQQAQSVASGVATQQVQ